MAESLSGNGFRDSSNQGEGFVDGLGFRVFQEDVDPGLPLGEHAEERFQVEFAGTRGGGRPLAPAGHAEVLHVHRHDAVAEGVQGPPEKVVLAFPEPLGGNEVHRVPNDPQGGGVHPAEKLRHGLHGTYRVLIRHGFQAHDGPGLFREPGQALHGANQGFEGPALPGVRVKGTVGIQGPRFGAHYGASKVPDEPEVFLEAAQPLFPLVRVGMNGIDIASQDGYGHPPGGEGVPDSAGGSGAQAAVSRVREGLGEGELDRVGAVGPDESREGLGVVTAEVMGPNTELQHTGKCIGEGAESKDRSVQHMLIHLSDVIRGPLGPDRDVSSELERALSGLRDAGGGTLAVGEGKWRTGPIELFSGIELRLEEGATLSFIPEPQRYRPVPTRWEGVECFGMHPCVYARDAREVAITGPGTIDGNGGAWWSLLREKRERGQRTPETPLELELAALNPGYLAQPGGGGGREMQFLRPPLVQFFNCRDVRIEGVTLVNSPFWTLHPVYCDGLAVRGVRIRNPHDAPNTDGIDIDSCVKVLIERCRVAVGDDGIALKSGSGPDGIRVNRPTAGVTVRDCEVGDGHGGIVIGSETAAGVRDVLAEGCRFRSTDRGIRIKTRRGRGGSIENLVFRDLVMEDNLCPVVINMYYRCGAGLEDGLFTECGQPRTDTTPSIRGVRIENVTATGCRSSAGFIAGLPESPVEGLEILNSRFVTDEASPVPPSESDMYLGLRDASGKGFRVLNALSPRFEGVSVEGPREPFLFA